MIGTGKGEGAWQVLVRGGAVASLLAAFVLLAAPAAGAQEEPLRVGYVDLQLLEAHYVDPTMQEPRAQLERELIALQAEFDQKSADLDDAAKQSLFDQYQERLDRRSMEVRQLEEALWERALQIIGELAAERGFDAVLQKGVVLYGGEDLTGTVLRRLGVQTIPAGGS